MEEVSHHVVQLSRMYVWEVLLPVPGGKVSPFGVLESLQVSASSHLTLRPLLRKKKWRRNVAVGMELGQTSA